MNPCRKVGIDCTHRCNWRCMFCFYRRSNLIHKSIDVPLEDIKAKILKGKAGGLDHVVFVGFGEPSLDPRMPEMLDWIRSQGMASSMISNGATGISRFEEFYAHGLDHLHLSSHGIGDTLDRIAGRPGAYRRQLALKQWLHANDLPWRMNVTLQQENFREVPRLVEHEIALGVYHAVLLNFIPLYHWRHHVREVAVHPACLRPYIETAAARLLEAGAYFTLRYIPFCHLHPDYWPYVVNARYVFFDNFEWNYELQVRDLDALWKASVRLDESVACKEPCNRCLAYRHCGGWNQVYADAFDGADLQPIEKVPDIYRDVWEQDGGLHDLNPVNHLSGTIR